MIDRWRETFPVDVKGIWVTVEDILDPTVAILDGVEDRIVGTIVRVKVSVELPNFVLAMINYPEVKGIVDSNNATVSVIFRTDEEGTDTFYS